MFTYLLENKAVVYGLGEAVRDMNKFGYIQPFVQMMICILKINSPSYF